MSTAPHRTHRTDRIKMIYLCLEVHTIRNNWNTDADATTSYRTADDTFRSERISGICVCETSDLESDEKPWRRVHLLAIRLASSVRIGKLVHASNCIGITDRSIRTVRAMRISVRSSMNFNTKKTKIRILQWVRWLQCGTLDASTCSLTAVEIITKRTLLNVAQATF